MKVNSDDDFLPSPVKRRRISHESVETAGMKTTGLDRPNASNDENAASSFKNNNDDVASATQTNNKGEHSQSKIKEENRKLLREIAIEIHNDPLQDIEDYDVWIERVISAHNDFKKDYDYSMKAKLILQFFKRNIKNKTGIQLNKIQCNTVAYAPRRWNYSLAKG